MRVTGFSVYGSEDDNRVSIHANATEGALRFDFTVDVVKDNPSVQSFMRFIEEAGEELRRTEGN